MAGYAETPEPSIAPRALRAGVGSESTKSNSAERPSFIAHDAQENTVVLSPRLKHLCGQVGGCQTEHVEAVIKRVMYEVLSQIQKY